MIKRMVGPALLLCMTASAVLPEALSAAPTDPFVASASPFVTPAEAGVRSAAPARPRLHPLCILRAVAWRMRFELDDAVPVPRVRYESETPLAEFEDAVEPQWGFRPGAFLNAYIVETNEIFILDDAAYYRKFGRFLDDSLAHEYAHYFQASPTARPTS